MSLFTDVLVQGPLGLFSSNKNTGEFLFGNDGEVLPGANKYTPAQKSLADQLANLALQGLNRTDNVSYSGRRVAPANDMQQASFEGINQVAGGIAPNFNTAQNAYGAVASGSTIPQVNRITAPGAVEVPTINSSGAVQLDTSGLKATQVNPVATGGASRVMGSTVGAYDPALAKDYWQKSVVDPAMENYEKNIVPEIQNKFIGANAARSGAAYRALGEAGRGVQQDIAGQLSKLMFDDKTQYDARKQVADEAYAGRDMTSQESALSRLFGANTQAQELGVGAQENYQGRISDALLEQGRLGESAAGRNQDASTRTAELTTAAREGAAGRQFDANKLFETLTQESANNRTNAQLDAASGAAGLSNQAATLGLAGGSVQRGISQEVLDAAQKAWAEQQPYNSPWLDKGNAFLGNKANDQAEATVVQPSEGNLADLLLLLQGMK